MHISDLSGIVIQDIDTTSEVIPFAFNAMKTMKNIQSPQPLRLPTAYKHTSEGLQTFYPMCKSMFTFTLTIYQR